MLTEEQAREAMLVKGYRLRARGTGRDMTIEATEGRRATRRTWTGISCQDLVQTFKLDQREANR